jgi:L-ascorbate metabolism protein UlaG (beta-lactamase superfamily)
VLNNNLKFLGQSGFRFDFDNLIIYVDPYLSNSLEIKYGKNFKRENEIPIFPNDIIDADYVFITHLHQDHCDLDTLLPIYNSSGKCIFVSTNEVCNFLKKNGFKDDKLIVINNDLIILKNNIKVRPIPGAHPTIEKDEKDCYRYLGFLFEVNEFKLYHSGDTFVHQTIIDILEQHLPINTVILPINEHNYFKEKIGIIGNMGIRDAFQFAELLRTDQLIPIHWDLFKCNSVYKEEIILLYNLLKPNFKLNLIESCKL